MIDSASEMHRSRQKEGKKRKVCRERGRERGEEALTVKMRMGRVVGGLLRSAIKG